MTQVTQPSRQQVREYLERRIQDRTPPPPLEEIRRQLGWKLIEAARLEQATTYP
jgi:hypothetical protein